MALATGDDVEAAAGRTLAPDETTRLPLLLEAASGRAEHYCGRRFARVAGDVVTIGAGGYSVFLPSPPVESVASATAGGSPVASTGYSWTASGELASRLGRLAGPVVVTYTHGYAAIPADVVLAVATLVAAQLDVAGLGGEERVDLDGYSVSYGPGAPMPLSDPWSLLMPYRLAAASVPVVTG